MKKAVLALGTCAIIFISSMSMDAADNSAIDAQIEKVISSLDKRDAPDSGKVMVQSLVNAIALAAPETSFGEELGDHVAKAKEIFTLTSIFNPDGVEYLHKSYRLTHSGKDFQMPHSIVEISDAVDLARKQLATARKDLKSDRMNECVQKLLEVTVMILTPKEKEQ